MAYKFPKELKPLVQEAERHNWKVARSKRSGHIHFRSPSGQLVVAPSTPSCWRHLRNTKRDLKKAGLFGEEENSA